MRSRLGRLSAHWSTIEMAISLRLSQRYFLSLLEGKTDCPISGVFGAGKTRAAAAIIAGLITVDPSLKIMILTKENVASQAFAEHIIGLSLPSWIEAKIGRLVGFMALHNQTTGTTKLDIPSAHRHEVIGFIIGCGGGFRHECASKYSPVPQWMSEMDLALHDESQQYGNLDETAAIARLPRSCLVMWLGDHRQTPGGLRKSTAARRFRRKLLKMMAWLVVWLALVWLAGLAQGPWLRVGFHGCLYIQGCFATGGAIQLQRSICLLASGLSVSGICHYIEEHCEKLIGHLDAVVAITVEQFWYELPTPGVAQYDLYHCHMQWIMTLGFVGHIWVILLFHREAVLRGMGTFLKA